jgi:hypothetical protein
MKKHALLMAVLLLMGAGCSPSATVVSSFEECVAAGNPVMESYPRQCRSGGVTYVEQVAVPPEPPPAEEPPKEEETDGETVTLKKGASATVSGGMKLTLSAINDSRCPKDVQCIWAGELAADLAVTLTGSEAEGVQVILGQTTKPKAEAFGRTLTLVAISETEATVSVSKP